MEGETEDISKLTEVPEEEPEKEEVVEYSPDPDVRLVRNIWTRGNVEERVKNVKFMWGIFACNELLFKRFGMGESDKCSMCKGKETPWHVIGECPGERAVEIRTDWAKRMWTLVQKETKNSKAPLDLGVANALKRMWKVEEGGALKTWQPGIDGNICVDNSVDSHLKGLIEKVAQAGSWAVWMGVYSRGWMEMLIAGGMSYHSARKLTGKLSKIITECRSDIAKERNERARSVQVEKKKEEREELIKVVKKLWEEDKRSVTEGFKLPLEKYLHSMRKMLSYKNQREKAINTAKKREDDARRIEELRQRQIAHERRQARAKEKQSEDRDRRAADVRRSTVGSTSVGGMRMYRAGSLV